MDDYFYDWLYFGFYPPHVIVSYFVSQSTLYVKYTTIFPIYQKISLKKIFGLFGKSEKSTFVPVIGVEPIILRLLRPLRMPNSAIRAIFAERVRFELTDLLDRQFSKLLV